MTGLEQAVAKISRVRNAAWLVWRLTDSLRPAIGRVVIQANRVLLKRAKNADQIAWCQRVVTTLQRWLQELDALTQDGVTVTAGEALPRKISHRARKRQASTLFAILIYLFISIDTYAQDWSAVHVDDHLVRLVIVSPDDHEVSICTGVLVNEHEGYVVAAAHCFPTTTSMSVAADKKDAAKIAINYALDIAVVRVKGLKGHAAHLRSTPAAAGVPIALAGYAFGARNLTHTFGWISSSEKDELLEARLLLDGQALAGMSGGGIFDQGGDLITVIGGIVGHLTAAGSMQLTYAIGPDVLREFLKPYLPITGQKP